MTSLIATVVGKTGYMSQDSMCELQSRDSWPSRVILGLLSRLDGRRLSRSEQGVYVSDKVRAFPRQRMLLGCAGDYPTGVLIASKVCRFENVEQFAAALPGIWWSIPAALQRRTLMLLLGYLPSASRVVGYSVTTENGFRVEPIADGSTMYSPEPPAGDPCELVIDRLVQQAVSERDIERVHLLIGLSVAEASRRGCYGSHRIGGPLHFARVTADGVGTRSIGDLG